MRASSVRGAIVVAAIVISAVVIANAFPSSGAGPAPVTSPTHSPSPTPTTPTGSPSPQKKPCPDVGTVHVAVENATSTAGLAAATATRVSAAGYQIDTSPESSDVGNAPSEAATTTIYFRGPQNKRAAVCAKVKLFKIATIAKMPAGGLTGTTPAIDESVQLAVYLGSDYAAAHPV